MLRFVRATRDTLGRTLDIMATGAVSQIGLSIRVRERHREKGTTDAIMGWKQAGLATDAFLPLENRGLRADFVHRQIYGDIPSANPV
jgi:hypothetical protein